MPEHLDGVIVAGAGPVGLVTALVLARAGVPVTVIDGEPEIIRSPRAIVYHAPTCEELDKLGLLDDLKQIGVIKQDYDFRTVDSEVLAAPPRVAAEMALHVLAYNLTRVMNIIGVQPLMAAMRA